MSGRNACVVVATGLALLLAVPAANAVIGVEESTSLDPLEQVLDAFAAGSEIEGLTVTADPGGPVVGHFQMLVNLSASPQFFSTEIEVNPVGVGAGPELGLVPLSDQLGENFADVVQIPPLHPEGAELVADTTNLFGTDVTSVTGDWAAFGETGPIEGPVVVVEPPTLIWGVELARPFDLTCTNTSYVGRTWVGQSVVSTNPEFTSEALSQWFPDTHEALADEFGRLIQLGCIAGGTPTVVAMRMTDDLGARPFGPTGTIALVNGPYVVFMDTLRTVDVSVSEPVFFSSVDETGSVALLETSGPVAGLVPNPYEVVPERFDFSFDQDQIEILPSAQAPSHRDLLYRRGGDVRTVGIHCDVGVRVLHAGQLTGAFPIWGTQSSSWREVSRDGDVVVTESQNPDGSVDTITLDLANNTFTARLEQAPGSEEPDCIIEGTFTYSALGDEFAEGDEASPPDEEDTGTGTPETGEAGDEPAQSEDGSSVLVPLVVAGVVVGTVTVVIISRRRVRSKPDEDTSPATEDQVAEPATVDEGPVSVPGAPPVVSKPDDDDDEGGKVRIGIVSNDGTDSVHDEQVFRVVVELPEQDDPPETIDVTLESSRDTETLTIAWDGNVGGPPRYVSQPITLDKGAMGEGKVTIFGLEFASGGFGGLWFDDGEEVSVSYGGAVTSFRAYDDWVAQGIGRCIDVLTVKRAYFERLLTDARDDETRAYAEECLDMLDSAERWIERDDVLETRRLAFLEAYAKNIGAPDPDSFTTIHEAIGRWADERADQLTTEGIISGGAGVSLALYRTVVGEASIAGPLFTAVSGTTIMNKEATTAERILSAVDAGGQLIPGSPSSILDDLADATAGTAKKLRHVDEAAESIPGGPWRKPVIGTRTATPTVTGSGRAGRHAGRHADETLDPFSQTKSTPVNPATARQKALIPTAQRSWAADVYVHGTKRGSMVPFVTDSGNPMSVTQVAGMIKNKKWYKPGVPVRLVSCHSADSGAAGALAAQLRTKVYAPTHRVALKRDGSFTFLGEPLPLDPKILDAAGNPKVRYAPAPPEAGWIEFDAAGEAVARIGQGGVRTLLEGR